MPPASRYSVSAAAHARLPHANPLSVAQMDELIALVAQKLPLTAIDIGCGPGSFSVGLAFRVPVKVRAIDPNREFLQRAKSDASERDLVGSIEFLQRLLEENEGGPFDLVVCIGSSGAVGTARQAVRRCTELLTESGTLVFADLVWTQQPPNKYLAFLGIEESSYWPRSEGARVFEEHGLVVRQQFEASPKAWKAYEDAVLVGRLQFAESLPPDEREAVRERAEAWFAMQESYGQACLGFVAYVAQRAEA